MLEEKLREVIIEELKRQAEVTNGALSVEEADQGIRIQGEVDIDTLVMAIVGAVAGGP